MHFSASAIVAALLASVVKADYIIKPDTVPASDRAYWCQNELATCPLICGQIADGEPLVNSCDSDVLTYGCICANGVAPNVSEYTLTLPYFTCVEWGNQCVAACGSDNGCADSCRADHPCGAQNPPKVNSTASSTSSAAASATSASADALHTSTLGGSTNAAIQMGSSYGIAVLAGVLFAGFALL